MLGLCASQSYRASVAITSIFVELAPKIESIEMGAGNCLLFAGKISCTRIGIYLAKLQQKIGIELRFKTTATIWDLFTWAIKFSQNLV